MKPTKKVIIGLSILILASLVFGVYGNLREGVGSSYKSKSTISPSAKDSAPTPPPSGNSSSDSSLNTPIIFVTISCVVPVVALAIILYFQMTKSNNTSVEGTSSMDGIEGTSSNP
jgi:hypothetical protein